MRMQEGSPGIMEGHSQNYLVVKRKIMLLVYSLNLTLIPILKDWSLICIVNN